MQRLMHVTNEMDEELERLLCSCVGVGTTGGFRRADKVDQDRRDVLDAVEYVTACVSLPTVCAREETIVGRVIAGGADVVQRRGPPRVEADLVSPGGYGREVAWCVAAYPRVRVGCEDGTDGVEDLGVEV
jgi:hypothetical protein